MQATESEGESNIARPHNKTHEAYWDLSNLNFTTVQADILMITTDGFVRWAPIKQKAKKNPVSAL